jgi:hypothetical protein
VYADGDCGADVGFGGGARGPVEDEEVSFDAEDSWGGDSEMSASGFFGDSREESSFESSASRRLKLSWSTETGNGAIEVRVLGLP